MNLHVAKGQKRARDYTVIPSRLHFEVAALALNVDVETILENDDGADLAAEALLDFAEAVADKMRESYGDKLGDDWVPEIIESPIAVVEDDAGGDE